MAEDWAEILGDYWLWFNVWKRFIPFLDYDEEMRRVVSSTNAIRIPERAF
jgi:hypothetical protein